MASDEEILKGIIHKVKGSISWWARLSYLDRGYWTEDEVRVLRSAFGQKGSEDVVGS